MWLGFNAIVLSKRNISINVDNMTTLKPIRGDIIPLKLIEEEMVLFID